jgi:hypothetical protein
MSELQEVCDALNAISGDIMQMARELHARSQAYNSAAANLTAAARSTQGEATAALARTADAISAAARHCGLAAQSLVGAGSEGRAFVQRTVGGTGSVRAGSAAEAKTPGRDTEQPHGASALAPDGHAHIDYQSLLDARPGSATREFEQAIEERWARHYLASMAGHRDVRAFTVRSFTYLWDADPDGTAVSNRLIGIYGRSEPGQRPRDESRIRGSLTPRPVAGRPFDRGHAASHSMGGPDEGFNLFGQSAAVNRGGRWRELETICAKNPGTFMFMRAIYEDGSDQPSGLEYGIVAGDGQIRVEYFDNE